MGLVDELKRRKVFKVGAAYAQKDGGLTFLKMDPMIGRIADDPRYAALLKKLGLPA